MHRPKKSSTLTPKPPSLAANPLESTLVKHTAMRVVHPLAFAFILLSQAGPALAEPKPAASIPAADLLQPANLAANLKNPSAPKPLILQVGFRILYMQAHIPDSEYVGAASEDAGLGQLRARVEKLAKDTAIVIYCGCCPWSHCPNIAAAYNALHALEFTRIRVLYIADNFGADWVNRGYPVAKGR
jgi:thiosulfate/3-mercaptopyruvate sulfurtransferase